MGDDEVLAALADIAEVVAQPPALPSELLTVPGRLDRMAITLTELSGLDARVAHLDELLSGILEALEDIAAQQQAAHLPDLGHDDAAAISLRLATIQDAVLVLPELVAGLRAAQEAVRDTRDATLSVSYLVEPIAGALRDARDAIDTAPLQAIQDTVSRSASTVEALARAVDASNKRGDAGPSPSDVAAAVVSAVVAAVEPLVRTTSAPDNTGVVQAELVGSRQLARRSVDALAESLARRLDAFQDTLLEKLPTIVSEPTDNGQQESLDAVLRSTEAILLAMEAMSGQSHADVGAQLHASMGQLSTEVRRAVAQATTAAVVATAAESVAPVMAQAAFHQVAEMLPELVAQAVEDRLSLGSDPIDVIIRDALSAVQVPVDPTAGLAAAELAASGAEVVQDAAEAAREARDAARDAGDAAHHAAELAHGAIDAAQLAADAAQSAADAARSVSSLPLPAPEDRAPVEIDTNEIVTAVSDAVAEVVDDAVAQIRGAIDVVGHPVAPAPGQELTAATFATVATALDEFGQRVEGDLDRMGERLSVMADVLERTLVALDEIGVRRGGQGEALALLRQIAAENTSDVRAVNNRRRNGPRGAIS